MNVDFEKALRLKVRYNTIKGLVTTEDLWTIPLMSNIGFSLDDIAKSINKDLKEIEEGSFVITKNDGQKEILELKFNIVKYIIHERLKEREERKNEKIRAEQKEELLALIKDKKKERIKEKSVEELEAMLKNL